MHGAHAYAGRVQDAAAALGAPAEDDPKTAGPLLKLAVTRVTRALTRVDSSSGVAGDGLDQLIRAYARACRSAPPAAAPLAKWLCALHFDGTPGTALWAAGTNGDTGDYLVFQGDGNLVVYKSTGVAAWSTGTNGHPQDMMVLQLDGNLVIYDVDGVPLWSSDTYGQT